MGMDSNNENENENIITSQLTGTVTYIPISNPYESNPYEPIAPPPPKPKHKKQWTVYALLSLVGALLLLVGSIFFFGIPLQWKQPSHLSLTPTSPVSSTHSLTPSSSLTATTATANPTNHTYTAQSVVVDIEKAGGNTSVLAYSVPLQNWYLYHYTASVNPLSSASWADFSTCTQCDPPNYWLGVYQSVTDAVTVYNEVNTQIFNDNNQGPSTFISGRCLLLDMGERGVYKQVVGADCI